jgi:sterol desaturase/sphingolipid hydroxylase (fatty acid hydroxylase superfamily)/protein-tyrosine-phosphatase
MSASQFLANVTTILAVMAAVSAVEVAVPLFPSINARGRKAANLGLMVIAFGVNWAFTSIAALLSIAQGPGLMTTWQLPMLAQIAASIAVLDFCYGYLAHVALHSIAPLWRIHAVHHSDPFVDVTTTYRTHPVESVWRNLFLIVPVWILGVPPAALVVYRLLSATNALLEHANLRVRPAFDRVLSALWVTPNMHKIHHSRERMEANSNYGNLLSIYDRMLRTFTPTERAFSVVYGLDDTDPAAVRSLSSLLSTRIHKAAPGADARTSSIAIVVCLLLAGSSVFAQAKATTVLFMCPHGAAKSVLASAYFARLAKERGLNVRVDSVGTDPQEAVSTAVAQHLTTNGYTVPITKPRKVTKHDLAAADVVISLGCDVSGLPAAPRSLREWNEVPAPSEDFNAADEAIRRRVLALVEELAARQKR